MTEQSEFPYVALTARTNGIHPTTARLLTIDAVTFDDAGRVGEEFHQVFNPGMDAGPRHTHGLEVSDFAQAPRFSRSLKELDRLVDAHRIILFDPPTSWGFIVSEAKRAMNAAARANRSRRGRGNRRRQRVGHVPRPEGIVDVLATVRRQGHVPVDARLHAVADLIGVEAGQNETGRDDTLTLVSMYLALKEAGEVVTHDPAELAADRFGLQRSALRVDAAKAGERDAPATPPPANVYDPARGLEKGMELVVTDDLTVDPDTVINLGVRAGLRYSEKLTRQSSLVVSEAAAKGAELRGKAMHAHRKDIPILTPSEFEAAVEKMRAGSTGAAE